MLCFGYNIKYLRKIQKYDHKNNITQIKLNESIFLNIFILLHLLISLYQTVSLISLQTALNSRPSGLSSPQYKFPNPQDLNKCFWEQVFQTISKHLLNSRIPPKESFPPSKIPPLPYPSTSPHPLPAPFFLLQIIDTPRPSFAAPLFSLHPSISFYNYHPSISTTTSPSSTIIHTLQDTPLPTSPPLQHLSLSYSLRIMDLITLVQPYHKIEIEIR